MSGKTVDFYDENAVDYAAAAMQWPVNPRLPAFLARCKPGGRILELGTGSGRDARAMLDAGFSVDPTDGSAGLAAIATQLIGQPVRTMLFHELESVGEYDGVFASASLLHVPRDELSDIIGRVRRALKGGGVAWASFKSGAAEGLDGLGRHYNYLGAEELLASWKASADWASLEIETWRGGGFDNQPTDWVAVTAMVANGD